MAGVISVAAIFVIPPPPPAVNAVMGGKGTGGKPSLKSVDWIGGALVTLGTLLLLFCLTEGNVVGWSTPWIPALLIVSLLIIAAFGFWQHHLERRGGTQPLVKLSVFRNRRFAIAILIMGVFFASFNNYLIFATYYFQDYEGRSPFQTMLRFLPTGLGGAIIAFIVAYLIDRVPTVFILGCGNVSVSISCLLFAVPIPPGTTYFAFGFPAMILAVLGADTTWPALTLFTSRALPPEDQAIGGALINTSSQLGRAIGLAISTATQTAVLAGARDVSVENAGGLEPGDHATLLGIRAANWVNFSFGIISLCLVPFAFRSLEIVGKPETADRRRRDGGEQGITHTE